ncbi:putative ABC transporter extracellular-binding protein YurO [Paenibacillus sp. CCS19]|uniref:ABC transporter substrate-binding protein n=1 Tax=Paenibacillus sp. CCS19 TaxID=3158387 RepID=UPI00256B1AD9|nr:extracellular solute-binding protein [Paenibacillus cellulosilyticus]GMK37561.1 putative ABC transporter extracellular-binding protein YurO [Paenibacillus cellulosilyticus]
MAIVICLTLTGCMSSSPTMEYDHNSAGEAGKQQLSITLVSRWKSQLLVQKLQRFTEEHPDVEIKIEWANSYNDLVSDQYVMFAPWTRIEHPSELYKDAKNVPDIVELVPNQMRELYHRGIIEPLNINETDLDEYTIKSDDGYVLGTRSKINPMILYYNKDIFAMYGIEAPNDGWDINSLNDAIVKLKAAGETVYIPLSPFTLEWATGLYGGRIVGVDGRTFEGYMDSEEATKAAKWITDIGTKMDYHAHIVTDMQPPMPYDLAAGKIALAVDFAYGFNLSTSMKNSYEEIAQENNGIGIAALPGVKDGINPAFISGLSLTSKSPHKGMAMQLISYLMKDRDSLYKDIATYTLQAATSSLNESVDAAREAILIQSMARAVPATLYWHEAHTNFYDAIQLSLPQQLLAIRNGQEASEELKRYASQLEDEFGRLAD